MEGYGAAGEGRYVGHVLQVATLGLDQGQGQSLLVAGGTLPVVVMVEVVMVAQVASPQRSHLGPKADCLPAHVHGVGRGPVVVLGSRRVAVSTAQMALEGVAHEGDGERVAKGRGAEPQ